jgi:hypothetical protein
MRDERRPHTNLVNIHAEISLNLDGALRGPDHESVGLVAGDYEWFLYCHFQKTNTVSG